MSALRIAVIVGASYLTYEAIIAYADGNIQSAAIYAGGVIGTILVLSAWFVVDIKAAIILGKN